MAESSVAPNVRRATWRDMLDAMNASNILELEERNAALEKENADLRSANESISLTMHASVDGLRHVTRERDQLRELIAHWNAEKRTERNQARRAA